MNPENPVALEEQIDQWRSYLRRRQAIHAVDVAELEDHLREQITALVEAGLADDEAFLVAVNRLGALDALSREFAREHSDRLWKQLVLVPAGPGALRSPAQTDAIAAFGFAVAAAVLIQVPQLFGLNLDDNTTFYAVNFSLFVLPVLVGYFVWKRRLDTSALPWLAAAIVAGVVFANVYPFAREGFTATLTALHMPIALWLVVGIAYAGGRWSQVDGRMDFIRVSGELLVYYALIAAGGGVLMAFIVLIFEAIGIDVEIFLTTWLLPSGVLGAVVVASWLVEVKQGAIENMLPVLTRLFTPPLRRSADHVSGDPGVDRARARHRARHAHRLRSAFGGSSGPAALFDLRPGSQASPRRLRCGPGRASYQCAIGRCGRVVGHRRAHLRFRLQPKPRGRPGRERDSSGESDLVRRALYRFPAGAWNVRKHGTVADELHPGLCRVGSDRRHRLSVGLRLHLAGRNYGFPWCKIRE